MMMANQGFEIASIGLARVVICPIGRETYYLLYNGYALLEIEEKHGRGFLDKITTITTDSLPVIGDCFAILAKQGELARRAAGLDPLPFLDRSALDPILGMPLALAVIAAVTTGLSRDIGDNDEDEDIDLILAEQQKKRKQSGQK